MRKSLKIGRFEIFWLDGGVFELDGGCMFGVVPRVLWKKKFPDSPELHGIPWTGIENATPEVKALAKPKLDLKKLPFDPLEYIEHLDQLPFDPDMDPDIGR